MLEPRLDPLLPVPCELDGATGRQVALDADPFLHVDVHAPHRVDQAPEAAQVDDDGVVDVEAGDLADDVDRRLATRAIDPGEQVGTALGQGPDAVHEALVAAVVAVGVERVQRVVLRERHALEVPGDADQQRVAGPGVRADDHERVGAGAPPVPAGVGADEQGVDAGDLGPGVGGIDVGERRVAVVGGGCHEHLVDDAGLHLEVAHREGGRHGHEGAGHDGRGDPGGPAAPDPGPVLLSGEDDRADPEHRADHDADRGRAEHGGLHGRVQRRAHEPVLPGAPHDVPAEGQCGDEEDPAEHLPAGAQQSGAGQHRREGEAPVVGGRWVPDVGTTQRRLGTTRPP